MPKISIFVFLLELQIGNCIQDSILPASTLSMIGVDGFAGDNV